MNTPPIPPNCPFIQRHEGRAMFKGGTFTYPVDIGTVSDGTAAVMVRMIRPIIAAVAAEYWRRERERLKYAREDVSFPNVKERLQTKAALDNECAWQEWGEG